MDPGLKRFLKPLNDLQRSVERFETFNDGQILPEMRVVIRLDAHRLGDWSRIPQDEYPCGQRVSTALVETASDVMKSGAQCNFAMVHGDELIMSLDPRELQTPRRRARLISFFSSAASSHFIQRFGLPALFHAKLAEFPSTDRVIEYFMWQRRCAYRNAIVFHLRRALAVKTKNPEKLEEQLAGIPEEERLARLEKLGTPISSLTLHARYGTLLWWGTSTQGSGTALTDVKSTALPENDEEFLTLLIEKTRLAAPHTSPAETLRNAKNDDVAKSAEERATPLRRESIRFSHEKGSKRNTLVMRVPGNYKR